MDRQFVAALNAGRAMLRKLPHWNGRLIADPMSCTGDVLEYAALSDGPPSAPEADEIVFVERSRLRFDSPEFALPSAARWSTMKHVDRDLLTAEAEYVEVSIDDVPTPGRRWDLGSSHLVVAVHDDLRIETWVPSGLDVAIVPLAETDRVELSWRSYP